MSLVAVASNPFDRYKGIRKPEEKKEAKKPDDSKLEAILEKSRYYLSPRAKPETEKKWYTEILTPDEISKFVQCLLKYEHHSGFILMSSRAIIDLIQNSHDAGYNNFNINLSTFTIVPYRPFLQLKGTEERPMRLLTVGNIEHAAHEIEWVHLDLQGNAYGAFAEAAKNCEFRIYGNAGFSCGMGAYGCTFDIDGALGNIGIVLPPRSCVFRVYTEENYQQLLHKLPKDKDNIVKLLQKGTKKALKMAQIK